MQEGALTTPSVRGERREGESQPSRKMFMCAPPSAVAWPAAPVYGASNEQPMVQPAPVDDVAGELSLATRLASVTLALSARYGPTLGLVQVSVAVGKVLWQRPPVECHCPRWPRRPAPRHALCTP